MDEGGFEMKRIQVAAVFAMALALPLAAQAAVLNFDSTSTGDYELDVPTDEPDLTVLGSDGTAFDIEGMEPPGRTVNNESVIIEDLGGDVCGDSDWNLWIVFTPDAPIDTTSIELNNTNGNNSADGWVGVGDGTDTTWYRYDLGSSSGWQTLSIAGTGITEITIATRGSTLLNGAVEDGGTVDTSGRPVNWDDLTYVPEPATMGLLGLGGLVALRHRRTR
jgi:hypothetical protein